MQGLYPTRMMALTIASLLHAQLAFSANFAPTTYLKIPYYPTRQAYFGDLHLHTAYSLDAYILLGTKVSPNEAYRFAKGEAVPYMGKLVRRKWPLDFMAVTDHSENMGVLNGLDDPNSRISKSKIGKNLLSLSGKELMSAVVGFTHGDFLPDYDVAPDLKSAWEREISAANENYTPGKFTTFVAYEWSSMLQGKYNLHRNVIFRGDKNPLPFTAIQSSRPEDLWSYLEKNRLQGVEALAIPHNSNASNGLMFDWVDSDGKSIDQEYAQRRAINEPLSEISQIKGSSETHPELSSSDEFANFELFDHLLVGTQKSNPPGSYIRDAYGRGLIIESRVGVNPYKIGVVGGTDIHNGLSTSDENAYVGQSGGADPNVDTVTTRDLETLDFQTIDTSSGALTGVWAEQNTRESIYDALRRKETFATSGPRIKLRFFAGWEFSKALMKSDRWVETAYAKGVPMGGDMPARPGKARPRFAVWATKDAAGANLDRIQIIKVWLNNGQYDQHVFDVVHAGAGRRIKKTGKLSLIGNTVDLKIAKYKNTIGATTLGAVWEDSTFDPNVPAVYYLRVIEIPTPRWSTILAVKKGEQLPTNAPATIQERGWSSPIWYSPATVVHPSSS